MQSAPEAKDKVEYVLRFGRLFLVFDEGAFLFPQRFSKTSPPMRLNWVRQQIVDRKMPLAIVTTPQSYEPTLKRFVSKTGYAIEQFVGRNLLKVRLPSELSEEDLLAVAKIHFPGIDPDYLALIAAKAMQSESYLKAMEAIAKRACYLARKSSSPMTLDHLEAAIADVMPAQPVPRRGTAPVSISPAPSPSSRQRATRSAAGQLQTPCSGLARSQISAVTPTEDPAELESQRVGLTDA